MVFITGPRQVGKTWLAKEIARLFPKSVYLNYDSAGDRRNIARSVLKEPKLYFYDTGLVKGDEGAIYENMVALRLLKHVYAQVDLKGKPASLHYIRTKDGAEAVLS